ncbi:hypothetical protein FRC07_014123, partial [Ceratobasidium sp. 392]
MGDVLPDLAAVENHAKITRLQDTVKELLLLVEDASWFVIKYGSGGAAVRTTRRFASSSAQDQVDGFIGEFGRLKEIFTRRMITQIVQRVEELLSDADRIILKELIVPGASFDLSRGCLEGTRVEILEDIRNWTLPATGSAALFWLYGPAGCGKSAIATSVSEELHKAGALGGSFFCRRDNENLRKPENVISQLAASLAYKCPAYGERLVKILRGDLNLAHTPMKSRFVDLMAGPLESMSKDIGFDTLVFVVDAIDESGSPEQRVELVRCLLELSRLASWLKVLVTSRPNDEIRTLLEWETAPLEQRNLFGEDEASVSRDIKAYIRSRICAIPMDATERNQWPNGRDIDCLSECANKLFIWARTACNLIQQSFDPGATLDQIINGQRSNDEKKALGNIYTTALNEGLGATNNDTGIVQLCVGTVVLAGSRRPLPDAALAALLSKRIKQQTLSRVVNRLGSVLYRDGQSAVRVLHQSFSDYMAEADCPEQYRIDVVALNVELAACCIELMLRDLRFNICNLKDSSVMNRDVADLQTRIESNIRPELQYSCAYWATHLVLSPFEPASELTKLWNMILSGPHLMYWIEVLSLTNEFYTVTEGMVQLASWVNDSTDKYAKMAADVYRFMVVASEVISSSTPHLYISALPFGAANYATLSALKPYFPNMLLVTSGMNLWNRECLQVVQMQEHIHCISISPDGRHVASGSSDKTVRIWNAHTGAELLQPLRGHSHGVASVAFSSDSRRIVSGSRDKTVRIWDAHTGALLCPPLKGHSYGVASVAFSPDGRRIVSASGDSTVRIWDAHTGAALLGSLKGHLSGVISVAFSPDGRRIISGSKDNTVRIWDADTGTEFMKPLRGHSNYVRSVASSPDGRYIASGSEDKTVRIWNAQTGILLVEPLIGHSHYVKSVAFSSDSRRIVSGSEDRTVRLWDAQTGAPLMQPLQGHLFGVASVVFSSDNRRIFSGSWDKTMRIWDAYAGAALPQLLEGHSDAVMSVTFSPNGRCLASGSKDNTARVWDVRTGVALLEPLKGHLSGVMSVAFSPDGERLVSGALDKTMRIWDTHTGASLLQPLQGHSHGVMSIAFSSNGQRIVSGSSDNTIRIWDAHTGTALMEPLHGHSNWVMSVAFSRDNQRIVSGSRDKTVRIWDAQTGAALLHPLEGHSSWVTSVAFSSDGQRIASGSDDMTVRIWDAQTGTVLLQPLKGHLNWVLSVAFSSDNQRIVSGSRDKTVRIWDAQTGAALLQPLQGHSSGLVSVSFSPDGRQIVSGSHDMSIRVWDAVDHFNPFDIQMFFRNSAG